MRIHKRNRNVSSASARASARSDRDPASERSRRVRTGQKTAGRPTTSSESVSASSASSASPDAGARASSRPSFWKPPLFAGLLVAVFLLFAARLPFAQETNSSVSAARDASRATVLAISDPARVAFNLSLVVLLIFINAFFAIAEIALITVRKIRIRHLVEEGNRSARLVEELLEHPTRLMATIQTVETLLATFSSVIAAVTLFKPLETWLSAHGSALLARSAETVALIAVALPVAFVTLVIGEIVPKSLAMRHSERLALLAVHPVRWMQTLLQPIVALLTLFARVVVRPFGGTVSFTQPTVNEEELKMLVEASEEQGVLEAEETEMIHSILNFGDTVVRKVMTPRIDITALDMTAPMPDLIRLIQESGHSRIPVYENDLDNIVGIVHAKDLLALPAYPQRDSVPIRDTMRPAYIIPETKKVDELLTEFQRSKQQLAIVSDEYGVTSGLVTIEDLLEEIVGDIQDEYDKDEPQVQVINATTTILDGKMSLSDVNERMGLELPEDEADTIGGFVFNLLGHQAETHECANWGGLEFRVEATDGRRIQKVRVVKYASAEASDPQEETFAVIANREE